MDSQQKSQLLQLPVELQLAILEYAIIEHEPLLVNCPCDSSYESDTEYLEDQGRWKIGEKQPPQQPGIARTCGNLRSLALPIFYQHNAFRAHYCRETDVDGAIGWLERIGSQNRCLLRDFCFWDMNWSYDEQAPKDLWKLKRSEVVRRMCGRIETKTLHGYYCLHQVVFGEKRPPGDEDVLEAMEPLFANNRSIVCWE